ncbi:MAG: hypothetical protein VB137_04185, partial [Burkholderia sp.]
CSGWVRTSTGSMLLVVGLNIGGRLPQSLSVTQCPVFAGAGPAKATITAFINQADCDDGDETDHDFMNRYGYPRSWDDEVPQPHQRPTPAGAIEAMLRGTACSSDELLFEGLADD